MFCQCSVSGNFLVKFPNHTVFCLSTICLFKGMLCFPVVWCPSNMESIICVFPTVWHCSVVLFLPLSLPDFCLHSALITSLRTK